MVAYPSMVAEYMEAEAPLDAGSLHREREVRPDRGRAGRLSSRCTSRTTPIRHMTTRCCPGRSTRAWSPCLPTRPCLRRLGWTRCRRRGTEFYDACKMVVEQHGCHQLLVDPRRGLGLGWLHGQRGRLSAGWIRRRWTSKMNDPAFVEWFELVAADGGRGTGSAGGGALLG